MEILKSLRQTTKLRQVDIANALGIARTTYAMYETGQRTPDKDMLMKLASFFEVSVDYLIGYESTPIEMSHLAENDLLDWYRLLPEADPSDLQKFKKIWDIIKED